MNLVGDQLTEAVGAVLSSLVDLEFDVSDVAAAPIDPAADPAVDSLTGLVTISGDIDAVVVVRCVQTLAADIAGAMFALPADELDAGDIVDALGEVTNMTGGSVKALLDGVCRLGLPIVTTGQHDSVVVPGARAVARTVFTHEARWLSLDVMLADEDAAIERWVDRITGK